MFESSCFCVYQYKDYSQKLLQNEEIIQVRIHLMQCFPGRNYVQYYTLYMKSCHAYSWYPKHLLHFWLLFPFKTHQNISTSFDFMAISENHLVFWWFKEIKIVLISSKNRVLKFNVGKKLVNNFVKSMLHPKALVYVVRHNQTVKCI